MVSINYRKELQNVLPKCNPFESHIDYDVYRAVGRKALRLFTSRILTSATFTINISSSVFETHNFFGKVGGGRPIINIAALLAEPSAEMSQILPIVTDDYDDIDDISDIKRLLYYAVDC